MSAPDPRWLAGLTLRDPAYAARVLMGLEIDRRTLWTGLLLMAVLQSMIFAVSRMLTPGPVPFPEIFDSPLRFFVVATLDMIVMVYAIHWAGRLLRGSASREDVLVLVVWLQGLWNAAQAAGLVLTLAAPVLGSLLERAAFLMMLYILLHFVDQAHRLGSIAKAIGVLAIAILGLVLAGAMIHALVRATFAEGLTYV